MKHEDKTQNQYGYIERLSIPTPIVIQWKTINNPIQSDLLHF
jgi:hypothetical protein